MDSNTLLIIASVVSLLIGLINRSRILKGRSAGKMVKEAEEQSKLILKEAEVKAESLKNEKSWKAKRTCLK